MKRETFVMIMSGLGVILGLFIVLGNKGLIPDHSFYLWPLFVGCIMVIILTHPISLAYHKLRRFLNNSILH